MVVSAYAYAYKCFIEAETERTGGSHFFFKKEMVIFV